MTATELDPSVPVPERDFTLVALGIALLRWRRTLVWLVIGGAFAGLAVALLSPARYISRAVFLPQGSQTGSSGLALAASQLGIPVPTTGGYWVSGIFVSLLKSRTLLGPISQDTFALAEERGRRGVLMDLLKVKARTPALRIEKSVSLLEKKVIAASDDRRLGTVTVQVSTPWASLSLAIAQRLVADVNDFNLKTRKSQASAERQFIETRVEEAERSLRQAENALQDFLVKNRVLTSSPALAFERDRLQRAVALQQQVYGNLIISREDAKIREVRDTPVITVMDEPVAAARRAPRNIIRKVLLGAIVGVLIGLGLVISVRGTQLGLGQRTDEAAELAELWAEVRRGLPFRRQN